MAASASLMASVPPASCYSAGGGIRDEGFWRSRLNLIIPPPRPSPSCSSLSKFVASRSRSLRSSSSYRRRLLHDGGSAGLAYHRKKYNAWKWYTSVFDELSTNETLLEQHRCLSCLCSYHRRQTGYSKFTANVFRDKSSFQLLRNTLRGGFQVHVPRAAVGPDEPHAASTAWPDGTLEKQSLDLLDPELERTELERFLSLELPSHPKLHRGQLNNGLRYIILPNKVPPNRFEAHMEVHVGSIDEEEDEQGIAHMIEHVAFLGSKKREKLLGTGARSNAYTDFHHTVFHIHSPTCVKDSDDDLLPSVLDALNEIAFHPKFLASRVEKERRAILSELQMMNTIEYRVDCQLLQHLHSETS